MRSHLARQQYRAHFVWNLVTDALINTDLHRHYHEMKKAHKEVAYSIRRDNFLASDTFDTSKYSEESFYSELFEMMQLEGNLL